MAPQPELPEHPTVMLVDDCRWQIPEFLVYRIRADMWVAVHLDNPAIVRAEPTWDELQGSCMASRIAKTIREADQP